MYTDKKRSTPTARMSTAHISPELLAKIQEKKRRARKKKTLKRDKAIGRLRNTNNLNAIKIGILHSAPMTEIQDWLLKLERLEAREEFVTSVQHSAYQISFIKLTDQ